MTTTVLAYIPSPAQGVWHLGPLPIRAYALCIITGIVAALIIGDRRWVDRGGEPGLIYDIALWAVPFGLVGGRLYHVMTDWTTYFGSHGAGLLAAFQVWDGGLGIWGAVALGAVGAWIGCRRNGVPLPAFGDAVAPGIILAQAIGRLGNYFNQELYGRQTNVPWGLEIFERTDGTQVDPHLLNGVSTGQVFEIVHPTFLYELIWNVLVFVFLIWADRRFRLGHGRLFALYVAAYCIGRFGVELMRSDHATLIAGIRVNSFTSTFVFIGAVVYMMVAPKGREDPASLAGSGSADDDESAFDEMGKELTVVASTSGVVAAAKVAGAEDESPVSVAVADEAETVEVESDEPQALEPDSEPEADAEDEAEPEAELESEAEAAEAEPESQADAEPASETAAETDVEPESPDEPEAAGEADAEAEPEAESADEDQPEAEIDEPEAPAETKAEVLDAESEVSESEPEAEGEVESAAEPEPEAEAESVAEPEPEAEPVAESEAEPEPAPEPKPRPLPAWEPMAPRRRWWQR